MCSLGKARENAIGKSILDLLLGLAEKLALFFFSISMRNHEIPFNTHFSAHFCGTPRNNDMKFEFFLRKREHSVVNLYSLFLLSNRSYPINLFLG